MRHAFHRLALLGILLLALGSSPASAAEEETIPIPEFIGQWATGTPFTVRGLRGKMAILFFYEESCPRCRGSWGAVNDVFKVYQESDNVALIAINSGTPKAQVQAYAQAVKMDNWTFLADENRMYEAHLGLEINLQHIAEYLLLLPDGRIEPVPPFEPLLGKIITRAKADYKVEWKFDAKDVPAAAKAMWLNYEYHQYAEVQKKLPQALRSPDAKVKEFATKLDAQYKADIKKALEEAKAKSEAGEKWTAFKMYEVIMADFGNLPETREANTQMSTLRRDRTVTAEFTARDTLQKGKAMLLNPQQKEQGMVYLKSIVTNYKDTEAARESQKIMDFITSQEKEHAK